ncbi:MAG: DUF58 domain-containing protein [Proteobacteria bacterium]|nr:DUF58 domain-containing protein [Pseudomonadota bacterium]
MYLIVAALLSFMGISGFFGKSNLSKITVEVEFPSEVYANINFPLKLTLKNKRKLLPVFLLRVQIDDYSIFFPFVDVKGESTRYVDVTFRKRGEYEIRDIYISSVFPFNFFTRYKALKDTFHFIVFPELKRCDLLSIYEKGRRMKGEKITDRIGYESDIISIREYVYGDPLKYINWKATAKTGKLKTKELSTLAYQPIIINFDKVAIKDLEEKLSCIAYSLLQVLKKHMPIGLKINNRLYEPGASRVHKINMLKELALYKPANGD